MCAPADHKRPEGFTYPYYSVGTKHQTLHYDQDEDSAERFFHAQTPTAGQLNLYEHLNSKNAKILHLKKAHPSRKR